MSPQPQEKALQERTIPTIDEVASAFASRGVSGDAGLKKDTTIVHVLKSEYCLKNEGYDADLLPSDRFTKVAQPAFKNLVNLMLKIVDGDVQKTKPRSVGVEHVEC